jgi:hypothetical protein
MNNYQKMRDNIAKILKIPFSIQYVSINILKKTNEEMA